MEPSQLKRCFVYSVHINADGNELWTKAGTAFDYDDGHGFEIELDWPIEKIGGKIVVLAEERRTRVQDLDIAPLGYPVAKPRLVKS